MKVRGLGRHVGAIGVALVIVIGGTTVGHRAGAHHDPPGKPALEDQLALNVIAKTDQDDGLNGESEYCVRIKIKHPGHDQVTEEFVNCFSANWDSVDPATSQPFDAAFASGIPNAGNMPLMGNEIKDASGKVLRAGGLGGGPFRTPVHPECSATAEWQLDFQLTEDSTNIGDILKKIGGALQEKKLPVPAADQGRIELAGMAATLVGTILDEIFGGMQDNLGSSRLTWGTGEGDPDGTVARNETTFHYALEGTKTVRSVPSEDRKCQKDPPLMCPVEENHLFSADIAVASRAWDKLREASADIENLGAEQGVAVTPDAIEQQKRALRKLVATLGRFVAQVEVDESLAAPGKVPANVLAQAQLLVAEGDVLRDQALASDDTGVLLSALDRYREAFELLVSLVHPDPSQICVEPSLVNELVSLDAVPSSFHTAHIPVGCPAGFVATFSFVGRLTNVGASPLTSLKILVDTLSNDNLLQNADGGPAGSMAILTVPERDDFDDASLSSGESVDVPFVICLTRVAPFRFLVDVLGIEEESSPPR